MYFNNKEVKKKLEELLVYADRGQKAKLVCPGGKFILQGYYVYPWLYRIEIKDLDEKVRFISKLKERR
jgi:hypothetical protein